MHTLGVIGGGNMGSAIVRGCIAAEVLPPNSIIIAETDPKKRDELMALGCAVTEFAENACEAQQILLAIKPQVFPLVAREIGSVIGAKVVISIMAGRNTQSIREALGRNARVIRAMPNVAAQIGAGMTAFALGAGASEEDAAIARRIFSAVGKVIMVDESLMHAVTAVSGSGPAYVFLLAEAMEQAAVSMGFDANAARMLVAQTVLGAGKLLLESSRSAAELRQSVTSPAGTTAAALEVFASGNLNDLVRSAVTAARDRGYELESQ